MPSTSSAAAEEGTVAHHVADMKLRNIPHNIPAKYDQDEMERLTDDYVAKVKSFDGELTAEQKLDISEFIPNTSGTADAVIVGTGEDEGVLTVVDLKYGRVKVYAEENPQLMMYGLGALAKYEWSHVITKVRLGIYQPRNSNPFSYWELTPTELTNWAEQVLVPAAQLAAKDDAPFNPSTKACQWCLGKATCPALKDTATQMASLMPPMGEVTGLTEQVINVVKNRKLFDKWVDAVEAVIMTAFVNGDPLVRSLYKKVEGRRGTLSWVDAAEAEKSLKNSKKIKTVDIYNPKKLRTPTQIAAVLGEDSRLLKKHTFRPKTTQIVCITDKRMALDASRPSASDDFKDLPGQSSPQQQESTS